MVNLTDYIKAILNNSEILLNPEQIVADKLSFELDFAKDRSKRTVIYKYSLFDAQETRFVIECAGCEVSINVNDNGYGGITVNYTDSTKSNIKTILALGFTDNKYYVFRTKKVLDGTIDSGTEILTPENWSVEKVLEIMCEEVKDAWENEKWIREAELIFKVIAPALALAVEKNRKLWSNYLGFWANKYQDMLKDETISDDVKYEYRGLIKALTESKEIIDGKDSETLTGRLGK